MPHRSWFSHAAVHGFFFCRFLCFFLCLVCREALGFCPFDRIGRCYQSSSTFTNRSVEPIPNPGVVPVGAVSHVVCASGGGFTFLAAVEGGGRMRVLRIFQRRFRVRPPLPRGEIRRICRFFLPANFPHHAVRSLIDLDV